MRLTNPLDQLLDSPVKVRLLRLLIRTNAELNGRQIARELKISPTTAHALLHSLMESGILHVVNYGRTHVYKLKGDHALIKDLLKPLFHEEEKLLEKLVDFMVGRIHSSKLDRSLISVILFGSIARRQEHERSDIDLCIIIPHEKVRSSVTDFFDSLNQDIVQTFGSLLSVYILTQAEIRSRKNLVLIKNIQKEGRLILGKPLRELL